MVKKRRAVKAANYGSPMKCFDVTTSATDKVMKGIDAKSFEDAARQVAGWSEHSKNGTIITVADRKGNTRSYEVIRKGAVRDVTGDTHEARQAMGASSTVRRRSRVTAAERPITPADRKRCIDFVARDYGVTKKQAAEWVKEYSDDRIRTLLGIESDQAKKAFIYDSTRVKRKTIVRASASAKRRAIKASSGERHWLSTELPKDMAWNFKVWLRDNGIKFEPSEADNLIHFEVYVSEDEAKRANDFIDSIDNGVSASAAPKRHRAIRAGYTPKKNVLWLFNADENQWVPWGTWSKDTVTEEEMYELSHRRFPNAKYNADYNYTDYMLLPNDGSQPDDGRPVRASAAPKRKFTVKASCGGKKPVKADYRSYEDPYKLEQMLEEAEAQLAQNPDDDYLHERVAELRDRVNFAWQDDEHDAEYADRFDDDGVYGKSNVTCTEKTDTFAVYNHGNFVSSGGYDALRGGIYDIVSVDEDAKKACIDYCNSFGDPVIEETATAQEVADTTTEVISAEYSDAWDAEEFAVYIGDHNNGVNIEIFDKALAAVSAATDVEIEKAWADFADVPMNPETEEIEQDFMHFPAGTNREEIWHWFDENHSKGVAHLLYGKEDIKCSDDVDEYEDGFHLYGYDETGADVSTGYSDSEMGLEDEVGNLFAYDSVDTVDIYEHGISGFGEYVGTITKAEYDADSTGKLLEMLGMRDAAVESAKSVKCGYDLGADTADDTYTVDSFFGYNGDPFRGLTDGITTDDWSEVERWAHEHLMKGENVKIDGPQGVLEITADEYNQAWEDGAADFDINEQIVDYKQRIVNSSTGITAASRSGEVDPEAVRELVLVITNDGDLYRERTTPMIENLKKKVAKGVYDREKAVKLWQYLADEGVRRYGKEYGPGYSVAWLSPATRRAIAEQLRDYYEEEIMWDVNHADDAKASTEITTL